MPLEFLSKLRKSKPSEEGEAPVVKSKPGSDFRRDSRKAAAFFKHAEAMADSASYDYSIECYIDGLRHDPGGMDRHEQLHEVAKKRKVSGGKAVRGGKKWKTKSPCDRMLQAERIWAFNPIDRNLAVKALEAAVDVDEDQEVAEYAYWIGDIALQLCLGKPDAKQLMQVCELFVRIPAFDKAVEACRAALSLDAQNGALMHRLKDLEAERLLYENRYGSGQKGDFRENIKDADGQRALEDGDAITKTESVVEANIERRRAEFEAEPEDVNVMQKYVDALLAKNDGDTQNEAIEVLEQAWKLTGQYRLRMQIGDIRMSQARRRLRELQARVKAHPDDDEARQILKKLGAEAARSELEEFTERAKQYPTDMKIRFDLGRRLFMSKKYDEAIAEFQNAKSDPKHRPVACAFLGRCYLLREWFNEAIDVLKEGLDAHQIHDDDRGLEMHYLLMDALEKSAREHRDADTADEAQKIASKILQTRINYRDITKRVDGIKALVAELKAKSA